MEQKKEIKLSESVSKFLNFINTHSRGNIQLTNDVAYDIRDVIEQNILDRNFKFSVPYYADGEQKIFFSIPYILADTTYRNTDLDTKDIQIKSDNPAALDFSPLLRGAVRQYLKDFGFNETMNDIRKEIIDMGHVLTKEVNDETKIVNLLNIIRPAEIEDLQDGGLAEITFLTWEDMLMNGEQWKDSWDKIEDIKKVADSQQRKTFKVYEWWTMDEFEVGGEKKFTKGCKKYLDCTIYDPQVSENPDNWTPYIELESFYAPNDTRVKSKSRLKKLKKAGLLIGKDREPIYPYEEERLFKIPGRWNGMGYYELLRNEGKAFNRTMNDKLRYDELLHKGTLVYTKAPFGSNQKGSGRGLEADIINKIQTGTMLTIKAGEKIDRLNMGSLTADFLASAEKWFQLARQKVGISETSTGERLPSSTPATIGLLNEKQAKNAFDMVNEQQSIFFEKLFNKFKLPEIIDAITQDEWTKIVGDPDELQRMEEAFVDTFVNNSIVNAVKTGKLIPQSSSIPVEDVQRIKKAVQTERGRQGDIRFAQFKKELINNFDFYVTIYVTNEAFDKAIVLNSLQEAINIVSANPLSEIDVNKLVEMKLDLMELNAKNLRKSPEQIQAERQAAIEQSQMEATGIPAVNPIQGEAKTFGEANQMRAT